MLVIAGCQHLLPAPAALCCPLLIPPPLQAFCKNLSITQTSSNEEVIQLVAPLSALQVLKIAPRHSLPWLAHKVGGANLGQIICSPCPPPDMTSLLGFQPAAAAAAVPSEASAEDVLVAKIMSGELLREDGKHR